MRLRDNLFIQKAFITNVYLWVHALGGVFFFSVLYIIFNKTGSSLIILLMLAMGWEVMEYFTNDVKKTYGSFRNFVYNATGDIIIAMAAGLIASINHWR